MTSNTSSSPGRLPSLDGWRAACIFLVLADHCPIVEGFPPAWNSWWTWVSDGNLGVRCFFVISGLLITWLMLREHERTGAIHLKNFYARRAFRILPVYFAFLAVIAILSASTSLSQSSRAWMANLTFTTNFFGAEWTTGHLWSIAIEEQFYLLWPIALVILLKKHFGRYVYVILLWVICGSATISRVLAYVIAHRNGHSTLFPTYSFFNYWDSIAVGCLAAYVLARREDWLCKIVARPFWVASSGVLLIALPYVLLHLKKAGFFTVPIGYQLQGIGLAILILQSICAPRLLLYRLLNLRLAVTIGMLSYSIYIWQQIFCTNHRLYGISDVWWLRFPGWLLPVFAVAPLSYYGLEMPFAKWRRKFREVAARDPQMPENATREF